MYFIGQCSALSDDITLCCGKMFRQVQVFADQETALTLTQRLEEVRAGLNVLIFEKNTFSLCVKV